jgi:hypothetical protein
MNIRRETSRDAPQGFDMPQPYTPTPNGFERRLRAWVCLPADDAADAEDANALPHAPDASRSER